MPVSGKTFNESNRSDKEIKSISTDILIIGGGTAGVIAAIQAGRAGVKLSWSKMAASWEVQ